MGSTRLVIPPDRMVRGAFESRTPALLDRLIHQASQQERDRVIGYDYLTVEEFREVITSRRLPLPFNLEDIVHQIKQAVASDMSPEAIFNLYCTMYNLERDGNYNLRVILNSTINNAVKERRKALTSMIFSK